MGELEVVGVERAFIRLVDDALLGGGVGVDLAVRGLHWG